jgi:hypothetical protein
LIYLKRRESHADGLDRGEAQTPTGLFALLDVPGLGPKHAPGKIHDLPGLDDAPQAPTGRGWCRTAAEIFARWRAPTPRTFPAIGLS